MRPVNRGPRPPSPVNEEISSVLPRKSTKNTRKDQTVHDRKRGVETGSEPVSLGSNPSSPVSLFSLQKQGFSIAASRSSRVRKNARGYAGAMSDPISAPRGSNRPGQRTADSGRPGRAKSPGVSAVKTTGVPAARAAAKSHGIFWPRRGRRLTTRPLGKPACPARPSARRFR